jgi:transposase
MLKTKNHQFDLRLNLALAVKQESIKSAAQSFKCSRNTARKWFRRYQASGLDGLKEISRRPHYSPNKTPDETEQEVIKLRQRVPFGAERLRREFGLKLGTSAIKRILRDHQLTRKYRRRRRHKKNDLRAIKAAYKPFTRFQMDVKYLRDIPNYWTQMMDLNLPRFQYTIREPRLGTVFLSFASELSETYTELTVRRLLTHLQNHGIDLSEVKIYTDNGSEFSGQREKTTDRGFVYSIETDFKATHIHNPPHCPNANADVESIHSLEEPEFFDLEKFSSEKDFLNKITTYQHYFNLGRPNSYKGWKTPYEILVESGEKIKPTIFLMEPVLLDKVLETKIQNQIKLGGHDVPPQPETLQRMII